MEYSVSAGARKPAVPYTYFIGCFEPDAMYRGVDTHSDVSLLSAAKYAASGAATAVVDAPPAPLIALTNNNGEKAIDVTISVCERPTRNSSAGVLKEIIEERSLYRLWGRIESDRQADHTVRHITT
jgi:hypothetical protein